MGPEDVQPAELLHRIGDRAAAFLGIGQVGADGIGGAAAGLDLLGDLDRCSLVDVDDGDLGAFPGEEQGSRPAHARGAGGDDRPFSLEPHHFAVKPPSTGMATPVM